MSEHAAEPEKKSGFRLPSAYTILFALIVLAAIATWIIPAGTYDLNPEGEPIPGTYHEVDAKPARILVDSLTAPINGLYGIEDATGNINYYNSGSLFGAIDIALFILVIGGFLGVTMKTGAIQAGIGGLVQRMKGRERLLIPALMAVFALGGTTYGMAEESLAFYALVITVLIAAGYDALTGAAVVLLGCGIGRPRVDGQPVCDGDRIGDRGRLDQRRSHRTAGHPDRRLGDRHLLRPALRRPRQEGSVEVGRLRHEGRERGALPGRERGRRHRAHGHAQGDPGRVRARVRRDDLRRDPVGGPGIPLPTWWWWFPEMTASFLLFAIIIGLVGADGRRRAHAHLRRRRPRPPRGRAHHRDRPRDHGDHEQRPDHGHGPALVERALGDYGRGRVRDRDVRASSSRCPS